MKERQLVVFIVMFLFLSTAVACAQGQQVPSEALEVEVTREVVQVQEVEVTREVALQVEVTREVEVEVTRLVEVMVTREVTALPEDFFVGGVWYGGQFAYLPEGILFQFDGPSHSIANEGEWSVDGNIRTLRITDGVCAGKTIRFETTSVRSMNEVTHVLIQSTCEGIGLPSGNSLAHGRTPFYDWQRELLVERGYEPEDLQ